MSRPVILGVLNVTPDSFSDGGRHIDTAAAVAYGVQLRAEGADYVDVGGESTRPGADRVPAEVELQRVIPVITGLRQAGVPTSVDTTRSEVAAAALAAGATMVNDVSGGLADPEMVRVVAEADCLWVVMHWRGHSRDMYATAVYADVVAEVRTELAERAEAAVRAGVKPERIILDPGLGFAKTAEHNWALLARLDQLRSLGYPLLIGASRKSFLGALLAGHDGTSRPVGQRDAASLAVHVLAAQNGAWGLRVHDVLGTIDALAVLERFDSERP